MQYNGLGRIVVLVLQSCVKDSHEVFSTWIGTCVVRDGVCIARSPLKHVWLRILATTSERTPAQVETSKSPRNISKKAVCKNVLFFPIPPSEWYRGGHWTVLSCPTPASSLTVWVTSVAPY